MTATVYDTEYGSSSPTFDLSFDVTFSEYGTSIMEFDFNAGPPHVLYALVPRRAEAAPERFIEDVLCDDIVATATGLGLCYGFEARADGGAARRSTLVRDSGVLRRFDYEAIAYGAPNASSFWLATRDGGVSRYVDDGGSVAPNPSSELVLSEPIVSVSPHQDFAWVATPTRLFKVIASGGALAASLPVAFDEPIAALSPLFGSETHALVVDDRRLDGVRLCRFEVTADGGIQAAEACTPRDEVLSGASTTRLWLWLGDLVELEVNDDATVTRLHSGAAPSSGVDLRGYGYIGQLPVVLGNWLPTWENEQLVWESQRLLMNVYGIGASETTLWGGKSGVPGSTDPPFTIIRDRIRH
jgi:hypothetical protein